MKKFYILAHVLFLFLAACDSDDKVALSEDCQVNSLTFSEIAEGVKMQQDETEITLSIARNCPEKVELTVDIPEGAKISSASEAISITENNHLTVLLKESEQYFIVTAEDETTSNQYNVSIIIDQNDMSLFLIEQTFLQDSVYKWVHEKNDKGFITKSKKVNQANELNFQEYFHTLNEQGEIVSTKYSDDLHNEYKYTWMYNEGKLTGYKKQYFNNPEEYFYLECNEKNQIISITEKNQFDYIIGKVSYEYNDNGLINKKTEVGNFKEFVYEYDDQKRVISNGYISFKYDEKGNISEEVNLESSLITTNEYLENGKIKSYSSKNVNCNYDYFENGKIKLKKITYTDHTYTYTYNEDGSYIYESVPTSKDGYYKKKYIELDINHNKTIEIKEFFHEDKRTYTFEYKRDSKGLVLQSTIIYERDDYISKTVNEKSYSNNLISEVITYYNGEFDYKTSYEYNDNGLLSSTTQYDKENNIEKRTTKTYDQYGKIASSVVEDLDRSEIVEDKYAYSSNFVKVTSERSTKKNDILAYQEKKEYYPNGGWKKITYIGYDDKGNLKEKNVAEYDENGNLISNKNYDADGNIIN